MYIVITLATLVCTAVLAVQTIRREQPQDRMRVVAIGGGTSVAMFLGAYILFNLAELPLIFAALLCRLDYSPCGPAFSESGSMQEPAANTTFWWTYAFAYVLPYRGLEGVRKPTSDCT